MRLNADPVIPPVGSQQFVVWLKELISRTAIQVNGLTEGYIAAKHTAVTSAPSSGGAQGDFVANATPTEAGSAGSKYVVIGWFCTAPGTWLPARVLTGN